MEGPLVKTATTRLRSAFSRHGAMIRHSGTGSLGATLILVLLIVAAPLPFAGVLPHHRAALQVTAFLALAVALTSRRRLDDLGPVRVPLAALLGVAALGVLQALPWPAFLVELLSPANAELWREAARLQGAEAPGWMPPSVAPGVSLATALHWGAVAAFFAAAAIQARERAARRLLFVALMVSGLIQILYGAERWLSRSTEVWGREIPGDPSRLRGTFVNSDHLAFYLGLIVPCLAAWWLWGLRKALDSKISLESRILQALAPFLFFSFFFAAAVFTGSRAGLVALIGGLALQGALLALRYRRWQWILIALVASAVGLGTVWNLAGAGGFGRLTETTAYELTWNARLQAWAHSFELLAQSPVLGSGLGTFRQAFPRVQPLDLTGSWHHAHSDVLELAVTVGLPCLVLLGWVLVTVVRRLWVVLHKGRRSEDRFAALGIFGAVAVAGLHSLIDFSLTMPANAFTLAMLVAVGCGTPLLMRRKRVAKTVFMAEDDSAEPLPPSAR